jgi:glyoxalase family protein
VPRGLHHVTALAGDAQRNLDFYTQFLGLRLIKQTVNFDDPATYHFYFGGVDGAPGTIVTFFPWPSAPKGRSGTGQAAGVSLAVPRNALGIWTKRARGAGIEGSGVETRFGEEMIALRDPSGLLVELIASEPARDSPAVVRLHSTAVCESDPERTERFLTEVLGFTRQQEAGDRTRFISGDGVLDMIAMPGVERGKLSSGMVHHIAFRAADDAGQAASRLALQDAGVRTTRVIDRQYFRSIYFREPGGVLFEIATDGPGFFVDESPGDLGTHLKLPPWLEPLRESIERRLPPVRVECAVP